MQSDSHAGYTRIQNSPACVLQDLLTLHALAMLSHL